MQVIIDGVSPSTANPAPVGGNALPVRIAGAPVVTGEQSAGSSGPTVSVIAYPATPVRMAVGAAAVIKAGAGRVLGLVVNNDSAAAAYVQFIDVAAGGVLGTGVVFELKVPAGASAQFSLSDVGINFAAGITIGSATAAGGAVASAAGVVASVQYK